MASGMSQYPQKVQNKDFIHHNCGELFNKYTERYVVALGDWYVQSNHKKCRIEALSSLNSGILFKKPGPNICLICGKWFNKSGTKR